MNIDKREVDGCLRVTDDTNDIMLVAGRLGSMPTIWEASLAVAHEAYAEHGTLAALDYLDHDHSDALMFAVLQVSSMRVLGGLRVHGPYLAPLDSHAARTEWSASDDLGKVCDELALRIPHGLVEVKTAFVDKSLPHTQRGQVSAFLSRTPMLIMATTGSRYMMATMPEQHVNRWATCGGQIIESIQPVPYPDERFRTRIMFWDWQRLREHSIASEWDRMFAEFNRVYRSSVALTVRGGRLLASSGTAA